MTNTEWLNNLQQGDLVYIDSSYNLGGSKSIRRVQRVTKTQIVLAPHAKYRKSDGRVVGGDSWGATRIEEATQERIAEVRKLVLVQSLKQTEWDKHPVKILEQIQDLLQNGKS